MSRFTPIKELAVGGQGVVVLARDDSGKLVVLKRCLTRDPSAERRLVDEGRIGRKLRHASIVRTLDIITEDDGRPVLVLDYVRGMSLGALRSYGPIHPGLCCLIGAEIASALAAIHGARDESGRPLHMLHRDVTPANILIDVGGRAKLIDLGIAKSEDSQVTKTATGELRGTLRYLAPELFREQRQTPATDLWALGVVILEAALGAPLHTGSTAQILSQIVGQEPIPRGALERVHPALRACLVPLLEVDPAAREQEALEAAERFAAATQALGAGGDALAQHVAHCTSAPVPSARSVSVEPMEDLGWSALLDTRTADLTDARTLSMRPDAEITRRTGTAVIAAPSSPPRSRAPLWAAAGGAAVACLIAAAGLWWMRGAAEPPAAVVAAAMPPPGGAPGAKPVSAAGQPGRIVFPAGSTWRYSDTGADLGTAWRGPEFDDAAWPSGKARLGFGGDGEATRVASGPPRSRNVTTYFRTVMEVSDPTALTGLWVRFQRDDGVALYLNGVEIARDNLAPGAGAFTRALRLVEEGGPEQAWTTVAVSPALLRPGKNLLAAEVHQINAISTDLGFDLEVRAAP